VRFHWQQQQRCERLAVLAVVWKTAEDLGVPSLVGLRASTQCCPSNGFAAVSASRVHGTLQSQRELQSDRGDGAIARAGRDAEAAFVVTEYSPARLCGQGFQLPVASGKLRGHALAVSAAGPAVRCPGGI